MGQWLNHTTASKITHASTNVLTRFVFNIGIIIILVLLAARAILFWGCSSGTSRFDAVTRFVVVIAIVVVLFVVVTVFMVLLLRV
jgi:hypothetical protein